MDLIININIPQMPYSISISRSIYLDIDVDLIINIDIPLKPYSIPISISNNLDIVKYLVKIKNLDIVKILSRSCQYQDILPTSDMNRKISCSFLLWLICCVHHSSNNGSNKSSWVRESQRSVKQAQLHWVNVYETCRHASCKNPHWVKVWLKWLHAGHMHLQWANV